MIAVGDQITVVDFDNWRNRYYTVAVVTSVGADSFTWKDPNRDWTWGTAALTDEDVQWTRGWHDGNSPAVQSLRVVEALT